MFKDFEGNFDIVLLEEFLFSAFYGLTILGILVYTVCLFIFYQ